jgi:hypothetical protein
MVGSVSVECYENIFIRGHFPLDGVNDQHVLIIQRFIASGSEQVKVNITTMRNKASLCAVYTHV